MKSSLQLRQMCPSWCDGRLPHSGSWRFPILANSWNSKCKKKPRAGNIATTCLKDDDFNQIFLVFYSLIKLPVNDTKSIAGWSTVPTAKRGTPPPLFPKGPMLRGVYSKINFSFNLFRVDLRIVPVKDEIIAYHLQFFYNFFWPLVFFKWIFEKAEIYQTPFDFCILTFTVWVWPIRSNKSPTFIKVRPDGKRSLSH